MYLLIFLGGYFLTDPARSPPWWPWSCPLGCCTWWLHSSARLHSRRWRSRRRPKPTARCHRRRQSTPCLSGKGWKASPGSVPGGYFGTAKSSEIQNPWLRGPTSSVAKQLVLKMLQGFVSSWGSWATIKKVASTAKASHCWLQIPIFGWTLQFLLVESRLCSTTISIYIKLAKSY